MTSAYFIGLMSGTSMDGVDAVLARFDGTRWLGSAAHTFVPYDAALKRSLLALQNSGPDELAQSALLAQTLAKLNAKAVFTLLTENRLPAQAITALGCHGQTIRHMPQQHYSIQLMDWALLAEHSGITTVGDFRSRDLAAGGQGAPLVPAFHQAVFATADTTRVVLNLGGIANISVLSPQRPPFGFDTGPANMLMDAWTMKNWQQPYDANGRLAAQGQILPDLLAQLMAHPYFHQPYPKSTGRELFALSWLNSYLHGNENTHDVLRTLLQLTAQSAVDAVMAAAPQTQTVYACGGGVHNRLLMQTLQTLLATHGMALTTTAALNLPAQQVEAAAFAWLAACWYHRCPVPVHTATGADGARILGCGYWACA